MDWSRPIDLYCERADPSFWAEPINALSNAAFLIAAIAAFVGWRRTKPHDVPALLLILLVAVIGIGSFIFHTVATTGAELFDTIPIAVFIYAYLALALRRMLRMSWGVAAVLLVSFAALTYGEAAIVSADTFNGSHEYLPALAVMLLVGFVVRRQPGGPAILVAGAVFALSIVCRSLDNALCPLLPTGTHFIWHLLNACVLYLLLTAAMSAKPALAGQGPPYNQAMPS